MLVRHKSRQAKGETLVKSLFTAFCFFLNATFVYFVILLLINPCKQVLLILVNQALAGGVCLVF